MAKKNRDGGERSKSFNRREWLFVICILLMTEYWIFHTARDFSNSQEVLNYVSFAGTIASIILAVIAIIYSFYQNDSQQAMSGVLANELGNLRTVADDLSSANAEFRVQLTRADSITDKLEVLDEGLAASRSQLTDIQGGLSKLSADRAELAIGLKNATPIPDAGAEDFASYTRRILRQSTFEADIFTYALYKYSAITGAQKPAYFEFLYQFFAEPVVKATKDAHPTRSVTLNGALDIGFQLLMVVRSVGMVSLDEEVDSKERIVTVSPRLEPLLASYVKEIEASENAYLQAARKVIDEAFNAAVGRDA